MALGVVKIEKLVFLSWLTVGLLACKVSKTNVSLVLDFNAKNIELLRGKNGQTFLGFFFFLFSRV